MLQFLALNAGTILVSLALCLIVAAIVRGIIRDIRKGKSPACGCACGGCPHSAACPSGQEVRKAG